jgi:hypothetical protein
MGRIHREKRSTVKNELRKLEIDPNSKHVMLETSYHYSKTYRRESYLNHFNDEVKNGFKLAI